MIRKNKMNIPIFCGKNEYSCLCEWRVSSDLCDVCTNFEWLGMTKNVTIFWNEE